MRKAEMERFANDVQTNDDPKVEVQAVGTDEATVVAFAGSKGFNFNSDSAPSQ